MNVTSEDYDAMKQHTRQMEDERDAWQRIAELHKDHAAEAVRAIAKALETLDELRDDCAAHESMENDPAEIRTQTGLWVNVDDYQQDIRAILSAVLPTGDIAPHGMQGPAVRANPILAAFREEVQAPLTCAFLAAAWLSQWQWITRGDDPGHVEHARRVLTKLVAYQPSPASEPRGYMNASR